MAQRTMKETDMMGQVRKQVANRAVISKSEERLRQVFFSCLSQ